MRSTLFAFGGLFILCASDAGAQGVTPYAPGPQPQLQSGLSPTRSSQLGPNTTYFGNSGLQSGVTSSRNPISTNTLVAPPSFSQGGVATVPGGDTATNSTNSSNVTSSTSGRGFSSR